MTLLAFDTTLMQPACVLVAVSLGASSQAAQQFPSGSWLLAPTDDMKVYETSDEQLRRLVSIVEGMRR